MGDVQTLPDYPKGLDFQQVWAALIENREQQKETDRIVKENAEQQKETDRQIKETSRAVKEVGKRLGDVVEYMVAPGLQEKFRDLGYDFQEVSTKHKFLDKKHDIKFEIDVYLQTPFFRCCCRYCGRRKRKRVRIKSGFFPYRTHWRKFLHYSAQR